MKTDNPILAKIFSDCIEFAKKSNNKCLYPGCNEPSINSHIMQKNGILSSLATDRHLWEFKVNHFEREFIVFKKTGINKIYTFLGFCNSHDTELFKKIETETSINFNDYESCLLFALRTLYNEYWLKLVAIKQHECVLKNKDTISDEMMIKEVIKQNEIAIKDLSFFKDSIWDDLSNKKESFIFNWRLFNLQEICLSSIYTYDTSKEIMAYKEKYGVDKDRLIEIFVSFIPYNGKSILLMGYHKEDINLVKPFVNTFFKENEKRVLRKLSNLIIFNCETWVCSEKFYQDKLKGLDSEFFNATIFSSQNGNERRVFDINMFNNNFKQKFTQFVKKLS